MYLRLATQIQKFMGFQKHFLKIMVPPPKGPIIFCPFLWIFSSTVDVGRYYVCTQISSQSPKNHVKIMGHLGRTHYLKHDFWNPHIFQLQDLCSSSLKLKCIILCMKISYLCNPHNKIRALDRPP